MRIVSTTGAHEVTHLGETFTASDGGIFDVPEHVGQQLTSFPFFVPEHVALENEQRARDEFDRDPARTGERVRLLEARVADLEAALADMEARKRPARSKAAKTDDDSGD